MVARVSLGGHDPPAGRLDLLDRVGQILGHGHRIGHRAGLVAGCDGQPRAHQLGDLVPAGVAGGGLG